MGIPNTGASGDKNSDLVRLHGVLGMHEAYFLGITTKHLFVYTAHSSHILGVLQPKRAMAGLGIWSTA